MLATSRELRPDQPNFPNYRHKKGSWGESRVTSQGIATTAEEIQGDGERMTKREKLRGNDDEEEKQRWGND